MTTCIPRRRRKVTEEPHGNSESSFSESQAHAASCMGVSESTVSRMKDQELEKLSGLLAACGLKVVPIDMHCYPEAEIEALRVLARRSDILRADGLEWED